MSDVLTASSNEVLTFQLIERAVDRLKEATTTPACITFVVPTFLVEPMREAYPGVKVIDQNELFIPPA